MNKILPIKTIENNLRAAGKWLGTTIPEKVTSIKELDLATFPSTWWRHYELEKSKNKKAQGVGTKIFENDPISNCWLAHNSRFSESDWILALKLHSATMPKSARRKWSGESTTCRRCMKFLESSMHIISM